MVQKQHDELDAKVARAKVFLSVTDEKKRHKRNNRRSRSRLRKHKALIIRLREIEQFSFRQIALVIRNQHHLTVTAQSIGYYYRAHCLQQVTDPSKDLISTADFCVGPGKMT